MEYHVSVMLHESIDALDVKKDKLYFDGTLGGGGHSGEILARGGNIIATDLDTDALEHCKKRFQNSPEFASRYTLVQGNFKDFAKIMAEHGIESIAGAILDLGISSHQIDTSERGFAYIRDAQLDMRMDRTQSLSAMEVINEYSEEELARIIFSYGEERFARRIAKNIVLARGQGKITTTGELAELIKRSVPKSFEGGHPAKKTFQAVRIEVNSELESLDKAIRDIFLALERGGRLSVISFHSLEDRIVKNVMSELSTGCICDKSLPICVCGHSAQGRLIAKKIRASQGEQDRNSRSKSATLRVIEKL